MGTPCLASPGFSPNITVDTRGEGDVTVTGRVLDGSTNAPLPGTALTLAGAAGISGLDGVFILNNVALEGSATLQASVSGYASQTRTVTAGEDEKAVDVGDILLSPPGDGPIVEWVKLDPEGCFLPGWGITFQAKARVNWNGFTPQTVTFFANHAAVHEVTGEGPEYEVVFSVDDHFSPSLRAGANQITVAAAGLPPDPPLIPKFSPPNRAEVVVVPVASAITDFYQPENMTRENHMLKVKVKFPAPALGKSVTLPVVGTFGGKLQAEGELSYHFPSGAWELVIGGTGKSSIVSLDVAKISAIGGLEGRGKGAVTRKRGFTLDDLTLELNAAISGQFRLGVYGVPDLLGPGISTTLYQIPALRPVLDNVVIVLMLKPAVEGKAVLAFLPQFEFQCFELTGKAALEAFYEPKIMGVKARFYVGGEPKLTFQVPGDFDPSLFCVENGLAGGWNEFR